MCFINNKILSIFNYKKMKVLFLLFLVFIPYFNSLQYITIGDTSLKTLNSSTSADYFYIEVPPNKNLHLVLLDNGYNINKIYICSTYSSSAPTESTLDICFFFYSTFPHYDSKSTLSGIEYYYKKSTSTSFNYIIIGYSGRNATGTIKAGAVIAYMQNVEIGYSEKYLTRDLNYDTYFYTNVSDSSYDYIYYKLTDTLQYLNKTIHYCLTDNNPKDNYLGTIRSCSFSPLDNYKKRRQNDDDEYYYKINITNISGHYVVVRYEYNSSNGSLYAQSSYNEFKEPSEPTIDKSLPTLSIVFIAIGGVALVGIMITIICYYRRKRKANNIVNGPTQLAAVDLEPAAPLVEKNYMKPTY